MNLRGKPVVQNCVSFHYCGPIAVQQQAEAVSGDRHRVSTWVVHLGAVAYPGFFFRGEFNKFS